MSVQELTALHNQYVDLSDRFRAAWAFHQFIQSVQKMFLPEISSRFGTGFQDTYSQIKTLSRSLNASETDKIRVDIERIGKQLQRLTAQLLEEDSKVAPQLLRQFFQRVKNYDEKILTQLVKFYIYSLDSDSWEPSRIDKMDYLLTRVAEQTAGLPDGNGLGEVRRLKEILLGLWKLLDRDPPAEELVTAHLRSLDALRQTLDGIETLDDLNDQQVVEHFRQFKHSLGELFFHPKVLLAIVETNLRLNYLIQQLYRQEERRIVTDYQRIFELEREVPVDGETNRELSQFRESVERFEHQLESQELRLQDLAQIRDRVRTLLPKLSRSAGVEGYGTYGEESEDEGEPISQVHAVLGPSGPVPAPMESSQSGELGKTYERLVEALSESSHNSTPKAVALSRELFPYRLESREVVAFRRLNNDDEADKGLERFILEAAALRVRINEDAEDIKGILDDTAVTGAGPIFERARRTVRWGDSFLSQFGHLIEQQVLESKVVEAHQLQILRMRLMRDYSGLWLLVYKRFLGSQRS